MSVIRDGTITLCWNHSSNIEGTETKPVFSSAHVLCSLILMDPLLAVCSILVGLFGINAKEPVHPWISCIHVHICPSYMGIAYAVNMTYILKVAAIFHTSANVVNHRAFIEPLCSGVFNDYQRHHILCIFFSFLALGMCVLAKVTCETLHHYFEISWNKKSWFWKIIFV